MIPPSNYRIETETEHYVRHRGVWEGPHTVDRGTWARLVWVGPRHAAPGWASADGER